MSHAQVAARVAANKAEHPEKYCPAIRCLYRTGDGVHCPKHGGPERTPDYCPPGWIHTGDLRASIYPLTVCTKCNGTGRNDKATSELRAAGSIDDKAYVRCTLCNGEGKL